MVVATLLGDLVSSRSHGDRRFLHQTLRHVLDRANSALAPAQPLEPTIGDEFQGCFETVPAAARASLFLRLLLFVESGTDSRYGIGWGTVSVFDAQRSPVSQDGPGWWAAREAIENAKTLAHSPRSSFVRSCFVDGRAGNESSGSSYTAAVAAFLICRDAAIGQMTERQRRLLLGVLLGDSQEVLAQVEGISQSAVSQTLSKSGATAIELGQRALEGWGS